jgi:hypothetical protein
MVTVQRGADKTAYFVGTCYGASGIRVGDAAIAELAHQAANLVVAPNRCRTVNIGESGAAALPRDGSHKTVAGDAAADQPEVADARALRQAEQADEVVARPVDKKVGDLVVQAVEPALKNTRRTDAAQGVKARPGIPVHRVAGVDVGAQHIVQGSGRR